MYLKESGEGEVQGRSGEGQGQGRSRVGGKGQQLTSLSNHIVTFKNWLISFFWFLL